MMFTRTMGILGAATAIALSGACTWVTTEDIIDIKACIDDDGDGVAFGDCTNEAYQGHLNAELLGQRDCNDDPAKRGAEETPGKEEIPYDGLDNDCSSLLDGADHDIVDVDGDGFPTLTKAEWEALRNNELYLWPSDVNPEQVDCNDEDAGINPGEIENWYDGIDADCQGDDDFDADKDLFVEDRWVEVYGGALDLGDCDDAAAGVNPGMEADEDDLFDGVDTNCDAANDFDKDGDEFIQGNYEALCNAYNNKYGYDVSCDIDDCNDNNDDIYPGARETPYDGIDSNCDAKDDFDIDGDGYIPSEYLNVYSGTLPGGDCNDVLNLGGFDVKPGQLEKIADQVDQDCDGDIDTTPFAYGANYTIRNPRPPVIVANRHHYLMTVAADEIWEGATRPPGGWEQSIYAYAFPFTSGHKANPERRHAVFSQTSQVSPLSGSIDVIGENDSLYVAYAYARDTGGQKKNWLFIRELETTNNGVTYDTGLANDSGTTDAPITDVALRKDSAGTFWMVACGPPVGPVPGSMQFLTAKVNAGTFAVRKAAVFDLPAGETCWLDFAGSNYFANVWNGSAVLSYQLNETAETITAVSPARWTLPTLQEANQNGNWAAFARGTNGTTVDNGSASFNHMTAGTISNYPLEPNVPMNVLYSEATEFGDRLYIASIVDDINNDGVNDVVLAYGPKNNKLKLVRFPYTGAANPQEPTSVSLFVDANRVALAVASKAVTNGQKDAVGWVFMKTP